MGGSVNDAAPPTGTRFAAPILVPARCRRRAFFPAAGAAPGVPAGSAGPVPVPIAGVAERRDEPPTARPSTAAIPPRATAVRATSPAAAPSAAKLRRPIPGPARAAGSGCASRRRRRKASAESTPEPASSSGVQANTKTMSDPV